MRRAGSIILAASLATLVGACVYDPVYEGIGCSNDQECPEGYWCAGSDEFKYCTSYQPVDGEDADGGMDAGDRDDGADPGALDGDAGPDAGDPGVDAADESDPGPADDGGAPDQHCLNPDQDGDGFDSLECGGPDCDDTDQAVNPAVAEGPYGAPNCQDGLDNNCDGQVDLQDPGCAPDWWDWNFRRRRKIAFDNLAQVESLVNFPVLVSLDGGENGRIDYAHTQDQGQDLRFVDADGQTVLAHEIESWNESGTSYVWVRVPQIDGQSNSDSIWMYYGNPQAPDGQQAVQVWSEGYQAVYHLHDDFNDSTGRYPASNARTVNSEGRVADGQEFQPSGFTSWIDMGENLDILQNVPAATLSAWMHAHTTGTENDCAVYISRHKQNPVDNDYLARALLCVTANNEVMAGGRSRDNENIESVTTSSSPFSLTQWHYLVGVIDYQGDAVSIYVDGQLIHSGGVAFGDPTTDDTLSTRSTIGSHAAHNAFFVDGLLDEIRVAAATRSADWIHAQYLSMVNQYLIFHGEESLD